MQGTGDDIPTAQISYHGTSWQRLRLNLLTPTAIVVGAFVIACFMVTLCGVVVYQSRADALERARETSRNIALVAERDIERNFELYALSLQAVIDGVRDPEIMALAPRLRREALFDRAVSASYLGSVLVLDPTGQVILDSLSDTAPDFNFSDRRYFTIQRDNPNVGLYVSDPYFSRLRGRSPSIALTRRISKPDGSFGGIVLVAVQLAYFHDLFSGLQLGPHGSMALIGEDGVMVMRQPYDPAVVGRNISNASTFRKFLTAPEGSFTDTASIDGIRRLYYFKHLRHLPLIIMVAEGETDIYAAWTRRALIIGYLMAAFAVAFVGLAFILAAQLRHRMRAESELALLARTDGLTGLNNRRTLGEILDQEWRRARRTRSVFSLLFVDVDCFKAYNDFYGHQAGDDALAAVAKCIGENIRRPADSAARYGGEEFLVVLPDTSPPGAVAIAENIRTAISNLGIVHAASEYGRVTASIGAAAWTPEIDGDVTEVIRAADRALYDAKATGRNRVAVCYAQPALAPADGVNP
ncbi:sensor domain-containing diguanylate cyclase [Trinickia dinghuensis]|uniref:diguanylate cyclase n=1 Tax=Trinickia dinghuensis TaxID=2291023 RepID=A0A3D8JS97_9BURK|nr:sensor domain-containing diguanylate cyclase [Trinickia dinghuensis]RDU95434.1 sensor domain-containing diguanylate cyclase [Trinickia dinghuensis]